MGTLHRLSGRRLRALAFTALFASGIVWVGAAPAEAVPATATTSSPASTSTTFRPSKAVQTQVDALTAQAQAVQAEIDALDQRLDQKAAEYDRCLYELDVANARLAELRRLAADARVDKADAQRMLAERIRSVYKAGGRDQLLQLLLLADGAQDLYNRVRLVSTLADQDKRLVANLKASSARLDLLTRAIDDQKRQELALKDRLSRSSAEIDATMAEREQVLAGLDARVTAIVEQERQRQAAEKARLEQELQAKLLAAQAAAKAAAQNRMTGTVHRGYNILEPEQIALVAQRAGFTGKNLVIAVAVALAESGGNARAVGDVTIGGSFGLWQVFCMAHPNLIPPSNPDSVAWYDPQQNANWAYKISGGSKWYPWSTYIHGTYKRFMATAEEAVLLVTHELSRP